MSWWTTGARAARPNRVGARGLQAKSIGELRYAEIGDFDLSI